MASTEISDAVACRGDHRRLPLMGDSGVRCNRTAVTGVVVTRQVRTGARSQLSGMGRQADGRSCALLSRHRSPAATVASRARTASTSRWPTIPWPNRADHQSREQAPRTQSHRHGLVMRANYRKIARCERTYDGCVLPARQQCAMFASVRRRGGTSVVDSGSCIAGRQRAGHSNYNEA